MTTGGCWRREKAASVVNLTYSRNVCIVGSYHLIQCCMSEPIENKSEGFREDAALDPARKHLAAIHRFPNVDRMGGKALTILLAVAAVVLAVRECTPSQEAPAVSDSQQK